MIVNQLDISLSNQHGNRYSDGKTTEKQNCELIGQAVKDYLSDYVINVNHETVNYNRSGYGGRQEAAEKWFEDKSNSFYLSIHTNAAENNAQQKTAWDVTAFHNGLGVSQ